MRCYRLPLAAGEAQELRCASAPITRLALSADDDTLFVGAADGSTFVMTVKDRDPARAIVGCAAQLSPCRIPPPSPRLS